MRPVLATAVVALVALASAPAWAQAGPASSQAGLRQLAWPGKADEPVAAVRPGQPARARPAAPNRYSARTRAADPVWNPFPAIAPSASASLRPAPQPTPPTPQPYRAPVVTAPPPAVLRPVAPPPVVAPAPAAAQLRQPPGPPMTVARPDRALAPAQPLRPASPAPMVAPPPPQATLADPEPPRSYADFSRPMTSAPARPSSPAVASPAVPAPALPLDEPPRGYADFSRPMSTPAPQVPAGQAASATGGDRPRYYSVHREYGRTPDHPEIPEEFFLDSVGGEDLAAPPPPTMSERDERRARAAAADPDAPAGQ